MNEEEKEITFRVFDPELVAKWSVHAEALRMLMDYQPFQAFQKMLSDLLESLRRKGLEVNHPNDRALDFDEINRKRGAEVTYEEILDLPSSVLAQIKQGQQATDTELKNQKPNRDKEKKV